MELEWQCVIPLFSGDLMEPPQEPQGVPQLHFENRCCRLLPGTAFPCLSFTWGRFHTNSSWCALNSPFRQKSLSSVCLHWYESINRTRVHTKSSGPRPPKRGGLGPLDSTPNAELPEDEGTSIEPILIRLQVWMRTTPQPVCYIITILLPGADQIIKLMVWKRP